MADDQLRPDMVAALTGPRPLPAGLVDQVLDASDAERAAAAAELTDRTRSFLEQAGVLKPTQSVLDLRIGQVQMLAATYGLVQAWWNQQGWSDHTLGGILKVVPADVAEAVAQLLRWGGFLPPDPALPPEQQE